MVMIVIPFLENHIFSLNQSPLPGSQLSEEKVGLRRMYQLNQKALHAQYLQSAHEFSTSANALRSVCRKWDYLVCHFATSHMAKYRQGLLKLWGRDENFTTVMSVIHCDFTGKLYPALHLSYLKGIKHQLFSISLSQWLYFVFLKDKF